MGEQGSTATHHYPETEAVALDGRMFLDAELRLSVPRAACATLQWTGDQRMGDCTATTTRKPMLKPPSSGLPTSR